MNRPAKASERSEIPAVRRGDPSTALGQLLDDIFGSRKRLNAYFHFKIYNDPTMNSYLYRKGRVNSLF